MARLRGSPKFGLATFTVEFVAMYHMVVAMIASMVVSVVVVTIHLMIVKRWQWWEGKG